MRESHGRQPPYGVLLDNSLDAVVVCTKLANQGFRFCVARQRDSEINISREPRLGADGHCQAADQHCHHENWDGTGYPRGVVGEAIPIGARILSVVDCFDALTSDRPYRGRMTEEDVFTEVVDVASLR